MIDKVQNSNEKNPKVNRYRTIKEHITKKGYQHETDWSITGKGSPDLDYMQNQLVGFSLAWETQLESLGSSGYQPRAAQHSTAAGIMDLGKIHAAIRYADLEEVECWELLDEITTNPPDWANFAQAVKKLYSSCEGTDFFLGNKQRNSKQKGLLRTTAFASMDRTLLARDNSLYLLDETVIVTLGVNQRQTQCTSSVVH